MILITKRDGTQVPFNEQKIINAINAAFIEVMGNFMKMIPQKILQMKLPRNAMIQE